jgi:acyl dehydratase
MLDRSFIGAVSETRSVDVEKGQLKFFAKATSETNPIYFDEEAAKAAGHPAIPAPPTFAICLDMLAPAKKVNLMDTGLKPERMLHGEQLFTHHRTLYAGDVASLVTKIVDIYDKKGGLLEFVVVETSVSNQRGELCTEMRSVLVMRNG